MCKEQWNILRQNVDLRYNFFFPFFTGQSENQGKVTPEVNYQGKIETAI